MAKMKTPRKYRSSLNVDFKSFSWLHYEYGNKWKAMDRRLFTPRSYTVSIFTFIFSRRHFSNCRRHIAVPATPNQEDISRKYRGQQSSNQSITHRSEISRSVFPGQDVIVDESKEESYSKPNTSAGKRTCWVSRRRHTSPLIPFTRESTWRRSGLLKIPIWLEK